MVDALAMIGDEDVIACDKLRGAGKLALIRRFPNGETHLQRYRMMNT